MFCDSEINITIFGIFNVSIIFRFVIWWAFASTYFVKWAKSFDTFFIFHPKTFHRNILALAIANQNKLPPSTEEENKQFSMEINLTVINHGYHSSICESHWKLNGFSISDGKIIASLAFSETKLCIPSWGKKGLRLNRLDFDGICI